MLKRNFIFDISTQRALLAFLMISFMSFSYATAQIREDKQQNSEKLDDLRIQIEQSTEKTQD